MSPQKLLIAYVFLLLGGIAVLGLLAELRRRRFRSEQSEDTIFRCEKCGFVYTDDADVDRSRCSQCGQLNEAIEF